MRRRAAAYYRVSADASMGGRSVERQRDEARQLADRDDLDLRSDAEFEETDSASIYGINRGVDRTEWQKFLDLLDKGEHQVAVLSEISRGTREQVAYQNLAQICIRHNILINAKGRYFDPDDESDAFMLGFEVLQAAAEVHRLSRRSKNGHKGSVKNGRPPAGRVPFGFYRPLRDSSVKVTQIPHPVHSAVVAEDGQAVLDDKMSLSDVAVHWSALGEEWRAEEREQLEKQAVEFNWTPKSPEYVKRLAQIGRRYRWNSSSVRKALLNPSLIGRRVVGKGTVEGNWEPIMEVETYYALHAKLNEPERKTTAGPTSTSLASAIALCGVCRSPTRVKAEGYLCREKYCVTRSIAWVDQLVVDAVQAVICVGLRDQLTNQVRGYDPVKVDGAEFEARKAELEAAQADLGVFQREAATAGLSPALVVSTLMGYQERVERAEKAFGELSAERARSDDFGHLVELRDRVEAFQDAYDDDLKERFGDQDVTVDAIDLLFGDDIRQEALDIWADFDLEEQRKVIRGTLEILIMKTDSMRRKDKYHPKAVVITPKGRDWDDFWRPFWTRPEATEFREDSGYLMPAR